MQTRSAIEISGAGFLYPLFGFGMRTAMLSGAAVGKALAEDRPEDYERFWNRRLRSYHETAATNRWLYTRLGDRGYRIVMRRFPETGDPRAYLHRAYVPRWWKRLWYRAVVQHSREPRLNVHSGCDCTWCRCQRHVDG